MSEVTYVFAGNLEFDVEFDYTGATEGDYGGPIDRAEPPQSEEIEITSITCNGKDVETDDLYIKERGEYVWIETAIEDFISTNREQWEDE